MTLRRLREVVRKVILCVEILHGLRHWGVTPPIPWLAHCEQGDPSRLNMTFGMNHVGPLGESRLIDAIGRDTRAILGIGLRSWWVKCASL